MIDMATTNSLYQLAFNAIPIGVGIYILTAQDKAQKDSLTSLKEILAAQDKTQKDSLVAQDRAQKDSIAALEKLFRDNLVAEKQLWSERFDNFIR